MKKEKREEGRGRKRGRKGKSTETLLQIIYIKND